MLFNSGSCISEGDKDIFGTMTSGWQLFYYFPPKAEALKGIQAVLDFPELKMLEPSDTRWLSHERCVKAIWKELPPLLQTLSQSYESSGNAGAYGIYSLLASHNGASCSYLLSEVLSALASRGGGGTVPETPKFGHIFVAVIIFFPFLLCRHFCKL